MRLKIPSVPLPFPSRVTLDPFHILQLAANQSAGSPVSTLFLKQSTYFEFSSLSPAPDWLLRFQSGTEETFKHAAPLPCLPGSAQSRNQPCNSAQVRPRFTIRIAAMLRLTAFSLEAPWFITPIINIFFTSSLHKAGKESNMPVPGGQQAQGEQPMACAALWVMLDVAACPEHWAHHRLTKLSLKATRTGSSYKTPFPLPFPRTVKLPWWLSVISWLFPVPMNYPTWQAGSLAAGQFFQLFVLKALKSNILSAEVSN